MSRTMETRVVKLEQFQKQRAGFVVHVCDPLRPHSCRLINESVANYGGKAIHILTGVPGAGDRDVSAQAN